MATSTGDSMITRQQWDHMKPFIQRIYIDENNTFHCVANYIQVNFGLKPTKRQFSRKIEQWGFRKNVSQSERRRIMKNIESEQVRHTNDVQDRRVNARKLQNWRRRYKEDTSVTSFPASSDNYVSRTNVTQSDPAAEITSPQSPRDPIEQPQAPKGIGDIDPFARVGVRSTKSSGAEPGNNSEENAWPFDWSKADIYGSPKLSRLFEGLGIACSAPIPAMSLDEMPLDDNEYISQHELSQLSVGTKTTQPLKVEVVPYSVISKPKQKAQDHHTGFVSWRDSKSAFCGWNVSPLQEIYVFPRNATKTFRHTPTRDLEAQAIEFKWRLEKLTPLCGTRHVGIRTLMNALAKVYHNQGRYNDAERWHHAAFDANRDALGTDNFATLDSALSWVDALMAQGRYVNARTHIVALQTTIVGALGHQSALSTRARFLEAKIAGTLGDFAKAEILTREVLQRRLNDLGPRHPDTWRSIDYLAWVLERRSRFSGAEKLSRIALQLYNEVSGLDEHEMLSPKRYLSLICSYQGRYDESRDLSRLLQENLESSLGHEHPRTLEAQYAVAISLRREGKFLESERLYQKVYSKRLKVLGESHPDTWNTASSLAYLLYRMNNFEKAIVWYEKFFWQRLEIYGPDGDKTINACCWLGDSYQRLGRYDDALKLYNKIAVKIRTVNGQESPALAQVQGLIDWIMAKNSEVEKEELQECLTVKERRKRREEKH